MKGQRFGVALIALFFVPGAGALAQDSSSADEADGTIDELIVTAQRREQNIQDVGISITAFTGQQISQMGLLSSEDLVSQVPNVQMSQGLGTLNIRGVSSGYGPAHNESPNAVYIDEVYLSHRHVSLFQMYDVERVEYLRGPQGTLFGRNATGGLVHYITRKPAEEFDAYIDARAGEWSLYRIEGAVGGSLSDRWNGRVSAVASDHDGYVDNQNGGKDFESRSYRGVRGQLEFSARDDLTFLFSLWMNEEEKGQGWLKSIPIADGDYVDDPGAPNGFGWADGDPSNPWSTSTDPGADPGVDHNLYNLSAKIYWDINDNVQLTSITSWFENEKRYVEDFDGSPDPAFLYNAKADGRDFQQEFKLTGEVGENLRWATGLFYLDIEMHGYPDLYLGFEALEPAGFCCFYQTSNFTSTTSSAAVYGHIEYDINDKFRLIAGLRYTDEEKTMDFTSWIQEEKGYTPPADGSGVINDIHDKKSNDENLSWNLEGAWFPTDNVMGYMSYKRGLKMGDFIAPTGSFSPVPATIIEFGEERLDALEVGLKSTVFNGTTTINVSYFDYDYKDHQISAWIIEELLNSIDNLDREIDGFEIEIRTRPTENLDLWFGYGTNDVTTVEVPQSDGTIEERVEEKAPSYIVNGGFDWRIPAGPGSVGITANAQYYPETQFSNDPDNRLNLRESYTMANAEVGYRQNDWHVYAYVRNAFNEEVQNNGFGLAGLNDSYMRAIGPPRWYGIGFRKNFAQ